MPSSGKNVSASYSSQPVSGMLQPLPGVTNQRPSLTFMTNQPSLAGTSPAPSSFSCASPIARMIRAFALNEPGRCQAPFTGPVHK